MKLKEKLAKEFVRNYASQLPGAFDYSEGMACFKAGFEKAKEMAAIEIQKAHDEFNNSWCQDTMQAQLRVQKRMVETLGDEEVKNE